MPCLLLSCRPRAKMITVLIRKQTSIFKQPRDVWIHLCMLRRCEKFFLNKYCWPEILICNDLKQSVKMSACKCGKYGQIALGNQNNHFNQVSRLNYPPSGREGKGLPRHSVNSVSVISKLGVNPCFLMSLLISCLKSGKPKVTRQYTYCYK